MAVEPEILQVQAASIVRSGALGRSRSYARLLEFLVECARSGRTPKELEIAMGVFGKGADFDPSQDSMVRVYAHNLRQKLEHFYDRITGCRVALTLDARHQHQGRQFSVHVGVKVPGGTIEVTREHDRNIHVALRDAFDAARRQLEDYAREKRAPV